MILILILAARLLLACSGYGCKRPICPACGECVMFCNCPPKRPADP